MKKMGVIMKVLACVVCLLVVCSESQLTVVRRTGRIKVFDETAHGEIGGERSERTMKTKTHAGQGRDIKASRVTEALVETIQKEKMKDAEGDTRDNPTKTETEGNKIASENVGRDETEKSNESPPLPNIVVLLADDLGFGDLSFSGHPTSRTPEMDKLASQSRFFTHHYVTSPVCSPSRASLLTGRLQVRSGVYPVTFFPESIYGLPRNETTIAALLKAKGYRTMLTGKWHLGVGREGEHLPTHFGFDHFFGMPYSQDMCPCLVCFPGDKPCHDTCWNDRVSCPLYNDTTIVEQPVYLPTLSERLVDAATTFITDAVTDQTPFFLYFPFHHIHHPQFASEMFTETSARGIVGDALNELDWAVGKVVATLEQHGLLSTTFLWFSSDNGPSLFPQERGGCAGLLRCGKGTTWEGGVRVPMFVHWPSQVSPGRSNGLVSALDLLPTVASLVGLNTSDLTLDGTDISPLLYDPLAPSPREYMPIYSMEPHPSVDPAAVTNGIFKAHFFTRGSDLSDPDNYDKMCPSSHNLTRHDPPLLYHLNRDPGERYDLSGDSQYRAIISDLTAWRDDHRNKMTWMDALTSITDPLAQPCCTSPSCTPFPMCCDCPNTSPSSSSSSSSSSNSLPLKHLPSSKIK